MGGGRREKRREEEEGEGKGGVARDREITCGLAHIFHFHTFV